MWGQESRVVLKVWEKLEFKLTKHGGEKQRGKKFYSDESQMNLGCDMCIYVGFCTTPSTRVWNARAMQFLQYLHTQLSKYLCLGKK